MYREALAAYWKSLWLVYLLSLLVSLAYVPALTQPMASLGAIVLSIVVPVLAIVVSLWQAHIQMAGRASTARSRVPPNRFWRVWLSLIAIPGILAYGAAVLVAPILFPDAPSLIETPPWQVMAVFLAVFLLIELLLLPLVGLIFPLIADRAEGGFRTAAALSHGRRGEIFARLLNGPVVTIGAVGVVFWALGQFVDPLLRGLLSDGGSQRIAIFILYDSVVSALGYLPGFVLAAALVGPYRDARLVRAPAAG